MSEVVVLSCMYAVKCRMSSRGVISCLKNFGILQAAMIFTGIWFEEVFYKLP